MRRAEPGGWTPSAAGPGPSPGESGAAPCRGGRGGAEPLGAVGFSSDTHLGRVCVAPDLSRRGNMPVGSVSLLLCSEPGWRGVRRAPRVRRAGRRSGRCRGGVCCSRSRKRRPRVGVALLGPGLSGLRSLGWLRPGGCSIPGPREERPCWGLGAGAPQRLWLVPEALGPCWSTCLPACPHGSFLELAAVFIA